MIDFAIWSISQPTSAAASAAVAGGVAERGGGRPRVFAQRAAGGGVDAEELARAEELVDAPAGLVPVHLGHLQVEEK